MQSYPNKNKNLGMGEQFLDIILSLKDLPIRAALDEYIENLRKAHARKLSINATQKAPLILELLSKPSCWVIEGKEKETRVILDPQKDELQCPLDISIQLLEKTPLDIAEKLALADMANYTKRLKKYLSGKGDSFFANWKLENYQNFNFPDLKKINLTFVKKQKSDARFNSINGVFYYQPAFRQVSFLQVKQPGQFKNPRDLMHALIKRVIDKGLKINSTTFDVSNISAFVRGYQKSWRGWFFIPSSQLKNNESDINDQIDYFIR